MDRRERTVRSFILGRGLNRRFATAALSEAAPRLRLGFASLRRRQIAGRAWSRMRALRTLLEYPRNPNGVFKSLFLPLFSSSLLSFPSLFSFSPLPMPHGLRPVVGGDSLVQYTVLRIERCLFSLSSPSTRPSGPQDAPENGEDRSDRRQTHA